MGIGMVATAASRSGFVRLPFDSRVVCALTLATPALRSGCWPSSALPWRDDPKRAPAGGGAGARPAGSVRSVWSKRTSQASSAHLLFRVFHCLADSLGVPFPGTLGTRRPLSGGVRLRDAAFLRRPRKEPVMSASDPMIPNRYVRALWLAWFALIRPFVSRRLARPFSNGSTDEVSWCCPRCTIRSSFEADGCLRPRLLPWRHGAAGGRSQRPSRAPGAGHGDGLRHRRSFRGRARLSSRRRRY